MTSEVEGLDLDALEKVAREATPGPWQLQDGCSWRRVGTRESDGNVLCPTTHHRDHHPDLCAGRGEDVYANLRHITTFDPPTVLRLLAALRAQDERVRVLEGENEQLRLAICGGEDAPGYAASLPLEKILSVAKDNEQTARRDAQLAWDGETATTWKARAEAAERRAGELEGAMRLACDLLAERTYGSRARSPGHNARLVLESALLPATQAEGVERPAHEPPWPAWAAATSKREGWKAFFAGLSRDACPFPQGRQDLQRGYREGWDAAQATQAEGEK